MKKPTKFLIGQTVILFILILVMDFTIITKFMLWVLWCCWTITISIMYAVIWRESVNCGCLEKEGDKE